MEPEESETSPGCPSPTDSEVKRKQPSSVGESAKGFGWPLIFLALVAAN